MSRTIIISDEVKEYLDDVLHGVAEGAWYEAGIKLDLEHYDGAIRIVANQLEFWRALANESLAPKIIFEEEIRQKINSSEDTKNGS